MKYEEIINLSRPESDHEKMAIIDRAAQFSAFAALTGLDEQMDETARLVNCRIELSDEEIDELNRNFLLLEDELKDGGSPTIKVIYFVSDSRKFGGVYETKIGTVKRIDEDAHNILFTDETQINAVDLLELEIMEQSC